MRFSYCGKAFCVTSSLLISTHSASQWRNLLILVSWFHLLCLSIRLSVHLSVSGRNHVCSRFSTILTGSILFLHNLSTNGRRCVPCWSFWKFKHLNFWPIFLLQVVEPSMWPLPITHDDPDLWPHPRPWPYIVCVFHQSGGHPRLFCVQPDLVLSQSGSYNGWLHSELFLCKYLWQTYAYAP